MSSAQERRAKLLGKSGNCCTLWCTTFGFTIAWSVLNIAPFIYAAVTVSRINNYSMTQNGSWCDLYDDDSYYWDYTYLSQCDQMEAQFALMLTFSLSYVIIYFSFTYTQ